MHVDHLHDNFDQDVDRIITMATFVMIISRVFQGYGDNDGRSEEDGDHIDNDKHVDDRDCWWLVMTSLIERLLCTIA